MASRSSATVCSARSGAACASSSSLQCVDVRCGWRGRQHGTSLIRSVSQASMSGCSGVAPGCCSWNSLSRYHGGSGVDLVRGRDSEISATISGGATAQLCSSSWPAVAAREMRVVLLVLLRLGDGGIGDADAASARSNISTASLSLSTSAEGLLLLVSGSSSSAAPRRRLEAAELPSFEVVGQPLPPCSPLGRQKVIFFYALMPIWRFFCSKAVRSRCSTPSGLVPGGELVCHTWLCCRCGGDGARRSPLLDCFCNLSLRVFTANILGLAIIFYLLEVTLVKYTPSTLS
jgi:hypothetical protein